MDQNRPSKNLGVVPGDNGIFSTISDLPSFLQGFPWSSHNHPLALVKRVRERRERIMAN